MDEGQSLFFLGCQLLAEVSEPWGSQGLLLHNICVLLLFLLKRFFRTCGFTVCLWGRIEINLLLHPNCLLNIIDHQSCQRGREKRSCYMHHIKGSFLWKPIYLEDVSVRGNTGRHKIGRKSPTKLSGRSINQSLFIINMSFLGLYSRLSVWKTDFLK